MKWEMAVNGPEIAAQSNTSDRLPFLRHTEKKDSKPISSPNPTFVSENLSLFRSRDIHLGVSCPLLLIGHYTASSLPSLHIGMLRLDPVIPVQEVSCQLAV